MEEGKGFWKNCFRIGTPQCGVLMGMLGIGLAFLFLFLGFWKTLMVAAFFAAGYVLGSNSNKIVHIKAWINKLFPPKGE
ncbi:MAG: DUF2273 domain-containing protein [Clostridia bacterium]|nr:DUF2273 domain-containing protein [Clostridia bacterium]